MLCVGPCAVCAVLVRAVCAVLVRAVCCVGVCCVGCVGCVGVRSGRTIKLVATFKRNEGEKITKAQNSEEKGTCKEVKFFVSRN